MTHFLRRLHTTFFLAGLSAASAAEAQDARMSVDPAMYSDQPSAGSFADLARFIDQDLVNERAMLNARRNDLLRWDADAQEAFRTAFGTDDPGARRQVLACIDRELDLNSRLNVRNFQPAPVSEPGRYAYVDHDDPSTIYLDRLYASAPAVGPESRAGTLVHETSHFHDTCATEDIAYGRSNAAALANDYAQGRSTVEPWRNADNIEFYVEDSLGRAPAANSPAARQSRVPGQIVQAPVEISQSPARAAQAPIRAPARPNAGAACDGSCDLVPSVPLAHSHAGGHSITEYAGDEGPTTAVQPTLEQPAAPTLPSTPVESGNAAPGARLGFDESASRTNAVRENSPVDASSQADEPQMTQEQFRAYMADTMRQFQDAAEGQRRELQNRQQVAQPNSEAVASTDTGVPQRGQRPALSSSASPSGLPARQDRTSIVDRNAAPIRENRVYPGERNSRPIGAGNGRYDADGYYVSQPGRPAPVRQNRVYLPDGSSRPIGAGDGRYDSDSYYTSRRGSTAPVRQNRAYMGNGSSRPIGASAGAAAAFRAFQQQANNQITRQQRGRANPTPGYSSGSSGRVGSSGSPSGAATTREPSSQVASSGAVNGGAQSVGSARTSTISTLASGSTGSTPAPLARLGFDDDAPRRSSISQSVATPRELSATQPANVQPTVSQSASSQQVTSQPATTQPSVIAAPVGPVVAPRQSGTASQTAGIASLK